MVDDHGQGANRSGDAAAGRPSKLASTTGGAKAPVRRTRRLGWCAGAAIVAVGVAALVYPASSFGTAAPARHLATPATSARRVHAAHPQAAATTTSSTTPVAASPPATSTAPVVGTTTATTTPPTVDPSIASLVAEVEAAGIVPGPGWTWTVGDVPASCHVAVEPGQGTGCTSWTSGVETTVFEGQVTLALVAHEVANAETEADAAPTLLDDVQADAAGSSWSATDAVATCLVAHFLGIQDLAAGSWQCPAPLATSVAAHLHDVIVTTRITAICGVTSGVASTLTFDSGGGSLTVSGPGTAGATTATAGSSMVVSGIGTFTADDTGGVPHIEGVCHA